MTGSFIKPEIISHYSPENTKYTIILMNLIISKASH